MVSRLFGGRPDRPQSGDHLPVGWRGLSRPHRALTLELSPLPFTPALGAPPITLVPLSLPGSQTTQEAGMILVEPKTDSVGGSRGGGPERMV